MKPSRKWLKGVSRTLLLLLIMLSLYGVALYFSEVDEKILITKKTPETTDGDGGWIPSLIEAKISGESKREEFEISSSYYFPSVLDQQALYDSLKVDERYEVRVSGVILLNKIPFVGQYLRRSILEIKGAGAALSERWSFVSLFKGIFAEPWIWIVLVLISLYCLFYRFTGRIITIVVKDKRRYEMYDGESGTSTYREIDDMEGNTFKISSSLPYLLFNPDKLYNKFSKSSRKKVLVAGTSKPLWKTLFPLKIVRIIDK